MEKRSCKEQIRTEGCQPQVYAYKLGKDSIVGEVLMPFREINTIKCFSVRPICLCIQHEEETGGIRDMQIVTEL